MIRKILSAQKQRLTELKHGKGVCTPVKFTFFSKVEPPETLNFKYVSTVKIRTLNQNNKY